MEKEEEVGELLIYLYRKKGGRRVEADILRNAFLSDNCPRLRGCHTRQCRVETSLRREILEGGGGLKTI